MGHLAVIRADEMRRLPWKNGRGVTEEIAVGPLGASFESGDFDWRVSRAAVVDAGPFSAFPGFDRVIVVTDGAGLVLSHGDAATAARIGPFEPHAFSGDWPTTATLVAGPVRDFNVLIRRGVARATVEFVATGCSAATRSPGDVIIVPIEDNAAVRVAGHGEWTMGPGDALVGRDLAAGCVIAVSGRAGDAVMIARIEALRCDRNRRPTPPTQS